ncbi:unnamed protein product [Lactuca saligna]|uniref:Uncharacterized protein n=1 Tax=Lactuca saligna TaxID=75948 RepID=A0AA35UVJ3_LACSI|nr:unnamed protein product [Lactuca saligna]
MSQLDAQMVDLDAPQTVDVDLDVDEGDDEEVVDNKGGGHRVSWEWQHFDLEAIKKGAKYLVTMLRGHHAFLDCKYLHLRCCAHIINLVVRDGLKEHFSSITKIQNAIKYVSSSGARFATFLECVEKVKINCSKKPSLDVDTR